jgi:hypothetical protein
VYRFDCHTGGLNEKLFRWQWWTRNLLIIWIVINCSVKPFFSIVLVGCSTFCKCCSCTENILYFTVKNDNQIYIRFGQETTRSYASSPTAQRYTSQSQRIAVTWVFGEKYSGFPLHPSPTIKRNFVIPDASFHAIIPYTSTSCSKRSKVA